MKKYLLFLLLLIGWASHSGAYAQAITLDSCLAAVRKNYPAVNKVALQQKINALTQANINTARLPSAQLLGQASYQSEVTRLDLPTSPDFPQVEPQSKDQYKLLLDVSQSVYDGGTTRIQRGLQELSSLLAEKQIAITLQAVEGQVISQFFNVLLAEENTTILNASREALRANVKQLQSSFNYGMAKKSQVDVLSVEVLKLDQRLIELAAGRQVALRVISLLSGLTLDESAPVAVPEDIGYSPSTFAARPERQLIELQKQVLLKQDELTVAGTRPRLSLFGQAGYGRPGLNFLNNDFTDYYIGGAKLTWNLSSFYTEKKERTIHQLSVDLANADAAVLENNLSSQYAALAADIEKANALLGKDQEIIALQTAVTKAAQAELNNGTLTSSDYLTELDGEIQAKQQQVLHQIQQKSAKYQLKNLTGN